MSKDLLDWKTTVVKEILSSWLQNTRRLDASSRERIHVSWEVVRLWDVKEMPQWWRWGCYFQSYLFFIIVLTGSLHFKSVTVEGNEREFPRLECLINLVSSARLWWFRTSLTDCKGSVIILEKYERWRRTKSLGTLKQTLPLSWVQEGVDHHKEETDEETTSKVSRKFNFSQGLSPFWSANTKFDWQRTVGHQQKQTFSLFQSKVYGVHSVFPVVILITESLEAELRSGIRGWLLFRTKEWLPF